MKRSLLPHKLAEAMDATVTPIGPSAYSADLQTPEQALILMRDYRDAGIYTCAHPFNPTRIYFSDISVPPTTGN